MKGMANRAIAVAAVLSATALCAFGIANRIEIRVRLIGAHSGKPYAGRDAQLFGTKAPAGLQAKDTLFHLQTKTGPDGVASFQISAPLPYRLVFYSAQANACGPPGFNSFLTAKVMRSGVVVPDTCAGKHQSFHWKAVKPQPGEIILFVVEPRGP